MKNAHLIKIGGIMALVCFLFMPVAGCGGYNISGTDLIQAKGIDDTVKVFCVISMICAVFMIFLPDKLLTFVMSIGGFVTLIIAYLIIKDKAGNQIEIKAGSYLSLLAFMASAVVSRLDKEIFNPQPTELPPPPNNDFRVKFCSSCGKQAEDIKSIFCENCGAKF